MLKESLGDKSITTSNKSPFTYFPTPMLRRLVPLLFFAAFSGAYTTFDTSCSKPTVAVNYVSSADIRGTMDILWSCFFTIIACTWTVLHLNVPEQRENQDKGWKGDVKWALKRGLTSAKWMLITVIAPELLLSKYWADLGSAKYNLKRFADVAAKDRVPWELSHCLFADMGGFVLRSHVPERAGAMKNDNSRTGPEIADAPTEPKASEAISKAIEPNTLVVTTLENEERLDIEIQTQISGFSNPYHLGANDIFALRETGVLSRLPYISPDELQDRSKSDSLVRTIAVVQILWVIIQILTRASRHLAISQLEIAVIAFASCAVVMYLLNWSKPKGVMVPITILNYRGDIPRKVIDTLVTSADNAPETSFITDFGEVTRGFFGRPKRPKGASFSTLFTLSSADRLDDILGMVLGTLVFGGIHLAAWNFEFPTGVEQILWWTASLWCTCIMFTYLIFGFIFINIYTDGRIMDLLSLAFVFTYVLARLLLIVEIFRTLFFLPPDAYIATWASNVPHIS